MASLDPTITIRRIGPGDARALLHLAQLDSSPIPCGPLLGAWLGGRLVAATALEGQATIADPFVRTAHLVTMLKAQVRSTAGSPRSSTSRAPRRSRVARWLS